MDAKTRDYLRSSVVTFIAGMAVEVLPLLNDLTLESVLDGALVGVLFVAVRGGVRAVVAKIVAKFIK